MKAILLENLRQYLLSELKRNDECLTIDQIFVLRDFIHTKAKNIKKDYIDDNMRAKT